MVRFVDLRSADIAGGRFAWFNTVSDQFVTVAGEQAWNTWAEFAEALALDGGRHHDIMDRFNALAPEWVFTSPCSEVLKARDEEICKLRNLLVRVWRTWKAWQEARLCGLVNKQSLNGAAPDGIIRALDRACENEEVKGRVVR